MPVEIEGPAGTAVLRMAVDTGATRTLINSALLMAAGYDLALAVDRVEMTTGSGIEYAARIEVTRLRSLGITRDNLPVLGHTLPPSAGIDGLLGLDFFSDRRLVIDFRQGTIDVT